MKEHRSSKQHAQSDKSSVCMWRVLTIFECACVFCFTSQPALISSFTDTEKEVVSVERTVEYIQLKHEDEDQTDTDDGQHASDSHDSASTEDEEAPPRRNNTQTSINAVRLHAAKLSLSPSLSLSPFLQSEFLGARQKCRMPPCRSPFIFTRRPTYPRAMSRGSIRQNQPPRSI